MALAKRFFWLLLVSLAPPVAAKAQDRLVSPRISGPIAESSLTTLRGNTHPLVAP